MKIQNLILPSAAVFVAATLLMPQESQGFALTGDSLGLTQRDFRVRNTFSDPGANSNQTIDDQFPGYTGAVVALWKGAVEWGSGRHGDGSGDGTQPQIGNGTSNFDPSFQGEATGTGTTNENIISPISSCSGGTLAFAELPTSNGWRIRFCEAGRDWHDDVGTIPSTACQCDFDLQEVGAHEYGHALGLGHSANGNATMRPGTPPGSEAQRSINGDDIAGIQAIYGVKDPAIKPLITNVSGVGTITILGAEFDTTNNEVWFTQAASGGNGTPIKAFNVPSSSGGTVITVSVPAAAGPGDVLVRVPGNGGEDLSNAYPLDTDGPPPETYCTGKVNNDLCVPFVTFVGQASASSTGSFSIRCQDAMENQSGLLIYGTDGRANLNFHNAKLCLKSPLTRLLPPKNSGDDGAPFCAGTFKVNFNNRIQSGADPVLTVGQTVNAQWIYRDPGIDQFNDGLSDGLEFAILP